MCLWILISVVLLLVSCVPGSAAFPTVAGTAQSIEGAANVTDHDVSLPASIGAGDLLVAIFFSDGVETVTWPNEGTDWVQCTEGSDGGTGSVYYRIASGSEGATILVTTGTTERSAHVVYRITGYTSPPECAAPVGGASGADPNPPTLTPSWGAADTLFIAVCAWDEGTNSTIVDADPANYTNTISQQAGTDVNGVTLTVSRRELNATSDDPGACDFTTAASPQPLAMTIAIQPAAPAAGGASPAVRILMR